MRGAREVLAGVAGAYMQAGEGNMYACACEYVMLVGSAVRTSTVMRGVLRVE